MARSSKYKPVLGFSVLLVGVIIGGLGAWILSESLFGVATANDPKLPKKPSSATAVPARAAAVKAPAPISAEALRAKQANLRVAQEALKATPKPSAMLLKEPAKKVPVLVPVPPPAAPAFEVMAKPFALRCPKAIRRFDRRAKALADVDAERFCASLKGRANALVFWETDCATCNDQLAALQGRASTYAAWPVPLRLTFVSSDERDSSLRGFFSDEKGWYFDTFYTESMTWLGDYGSAIGLPDAPWVVVVDATRQVVYEGSGPKDAASLKDFEAFLQKVAERPATKTSAVATDKKAGGTGKPSKASAAKAAAKTSAKKASAKKSSPRKAKASSSRRKIDYVNLGLQIMRLYPELAQSPDLRKVVKASERILNKKLAGMSASAASKAAANLPDKMVRSAVSTAKKGLGIL